MVATENETTEQAARKIERWNTKPIHAPRAANEETRQQVGEQWWVNHRFARRTHGQRRGWRMCMVLVCSWLPVMEEVGLLNLLVMILATEYPKQFARGRREALRIRKTTDTRYLKTVSISDRDR